jgi:hypothetical protein
LWEKEKKRNKNQAKNLGEWESIPQPQAKNRKARPHVILPYLVLCNNKLVPNMANKYKQTGSFTSLFISHRIPKMT